MRPDSLNCAAKVKLQNDMILLPTDKCCMLYLTVLASFIDVTWCSVVLSPTVKDVVRYVNESYIVTCIEDRMKPVRWMKGERAAIGDKGHPHTTMLTLGAALVFERILADDRGQYSCRTDEDSASFKLIVISPISFTETPSVQTAEEHQATIVKCAVRGDPKPKILWKFEGKDVTPPKYSLVNGGLRIANVTLNDKGTYTCRAYQVSQVTSMFEEKSIKLNVQHKPMHEKPVHVRAYQAYGYIGGEVNLTCEAVAEPAANFTWFRQHKKTIPGRIIQIPHLSTLQLYVQNDSTFGDYLCKATNKLGTLDQIISLQKGVKPPKPQHIKVVDVSTDTLSIELLGPDLNQTQLVKDMLPVGYRLQYRPTGSSTKWNDAAFRDFDDIGEDEKYVITGLNHNTDYEIRAATINLAGISDYTPITVRRTLSLQADSISSIAMKTASFHHQLATVVILYTMEHL
ncbi:factor of interpulse interval [Carabus blaptoides fortunei]